MTHRPYQQPTSTYSLDSCLMIEHSILNYIGVDQQVDKLSARDKCLLEHRTHKHTLTDPKP